MSDFQLLDGKQTAARIREQLKTKIAAKRAAGANAPGLAVILVGDDTPSQIYVRNKKKACAEVGMYTQSFDLPNNTEQNTLLALIDELNADPNIHGILVQLPLPPQIDSYQVIDRILPIKDVDGFHPYTLGRLTQRRPLLRPCTPLGIITLLQHYGIQLKGINATVVGASNLVGRPMALELLLCGASVSITHRFTKDLAPFVKQAELLIVATGKPNIVDPSWLKAGVIVVDVGINRLQDGSLRGDIDFAAASERARWITPVPGGVGPMTIAMLLQNTLAAQALSENDAQRAKTDC